MTPIQSEYQRLVEFSQTVHGWRQIEDSWTAVTNQKFVEGRLQRTGEANRAIVRGFAIDPVTRHCIPSCSTHHSRAYLDMIDWIASKESIEDVDAIMDRPIKGWLGSILDFKFPCVLMGDPRLFSDNELLQSVEDAILQQEIGLPLNRVFLERARGSLGGSV